jgi:hypothetical protein
MNVSDAKKFGEDENAVYACVGAQQNRTWSNSVAGAIDHAANLIAGSNSTHELLIIKVVGRVRRRVPVDFIPIEEA